MANATRYFDLTPAANGFGTLNGAWDTTTANWTASSTGASGTNVAYTFDNTDTAAFGSATTAPVAGTATISTGITVTLNQIVTANMAGSQIIAAAGTGKLSLSGTSPTLNIGSSGGLSITAPIIGTAGFTKSGTGTLALQNTSNSFSGASNPVVITTGLLFDGGLTAPLAPVATTTLSGITSIAVSANAFYAIGATGDAFAVSAPLSGAGLVIVASVGTTVGPTFAANCLAGLTGTTAPTGSGTSSVNVAAGFYVYGEGNTTNRKASYATVNDFPATGNTSWMMEATTTNCASVIKYAGSGGTFNGPLYALLRSATNLATSTTALYANGSGALVLTGAFKRDGTTGTFVFTLGGTSASNISNTLSGNITETGGVFAISKVDANTWVLSGASSNYTGTNTVSAGTLSAQGAAGTRTPLGSASAGDLTVSGTGTLDISSAGTTTSSRMTLNKGSRTFTTGGTGTNQLTSTTGYNVLSCGGFTLNTNLPISVAAGAYLKLNNSAAMSGATRSVTKSGDGEFDFGTFANTFSSTSGTVVVSAGTVSFGASVSSAAGPLGQQTTAIDLGGTLKYNGAASGSLSRGVRFTGAAAFEAAGTTSANTFSVLSTLTHSGAGARTLTLKGDNTGNNAIGSAIANNSVDSSAVSVTKEGVGTWYMTNANANLGGFTGALTVAGGVLDLNNVARSPAGDIVATGGTLQNGAAIVTVATSVALSGGKIAANLSGATKTLTVTGASLATVSELAPQATNNAGLTGGTASVNGGTLRLTAETSTFATGGGTVLGTMATTVANGAAIRTTTGSFQLGRARYGSSLTFENGSALYIGG